MQPKARAMLENVYDLISKKVQDNKKAWDYLVEFVAVDNRAGLIFDIDHKFEWLFEDNGLAKKILEIYDDELLRTDYYDHLGDMYIHHVLPMNEQMTKTHYIRHQTAIDVLADTIITDSNEPFKFLDIEAGTGRLLMAAYKQTPKAHLFGVERNLDLYRIALANFAIHEIPAQMLHADLGIYEIDISLPNGRYNWQFANRWKIDKNKFRLNSKSYSPLKQK